MNRQAWTAEEIQFARENWTSMPHRELAAQLGRNIHTVIAFMYRRGFSQRAPAQTYEHLTPEELAYIAGIIDGEGHIEIGLGKEFVTKQTRWSISVKVSNTNYELLDWMRRRLPGSYIQEKVYGAPRKLHWKQAWNLRLHRRGSVLSLLTAVLPYLIVKRERALAAIAAINGIHNRQWR